jgi:acetyl esterase
MAIDEATAGFLTQLTAAGPPLHQLSASDARMAAAGLKDFLGTGPEMAEMRDELILVDGGTVLARVLRPSGTPKGILVFIHGGGWVIGSADEYETLARTLAARTGLTTVLVEYRKAPEHRFPVAADDSWAALAWVDAHREELAGTDAPLVVAGDSAGGNLTAVMTLRARAAGGPRIDLQLLIYPATDCDFDTPCYTAPENQLMLDRTGMIWFWDHYAPDPAVRTVPDASPARAESLSDLPPAVVLTAEYDVLRDEGEAYAQRLAEAGVPVRHQRFDGQIHGFFSMVNLLPGSAAGIDYAVAAIEELLPATSA